MCRKSTLENYGRRPRWSRGRHELEPPARFESVSFLFLFLFILLLHQPQLNRLSMNRLFTHQFFLSVYVSIFIHSVYFSSLNLTGSWWTKMLPTYSFCGLLSVLTLKFEISSALCRGDFIDLVLDLNPYCLT